MTRTGPGPIVLGAAVVTAAVGLLGAEAAAQTAAASADDICPPTTDPCVISQQFEILAPGDLDFGTRTVRITNGGRLLRTSTVTCGDFIVDSGGSSVAVDTNEDDNIAGSFTLNASGTVTIDGQIRSRGNPGGLVRIRADGDITIESKILADGSPVGSPGGEIEIESFAGSVTLTDTLSNKATKGSAYETEQGGTTTIRASLDLTITGAIDSGGGQQGGSALIQAGRDLVLRNDVDASAGPGIAYGQGGGIDISGRESVTISGSGGSGTGQVRLTNKGSLGYYIGGGYIYAYVGPGGYTYIESDQGDVFLSRNVDALANSGAGSAYGSAQGGVMYLRAYQGQIYVGGNLEVTAYGESSNGGFVFIEAYEAFVQGDGSSIEARGKYAGGVNARVYGYGPQSRIDGRIDVRGRLASGAYGSYEGGGGYFEFFGDTVDLGVDGRILGGAESAGEFSLAMCRLDLGSGATIDNAHGSPEGGGSIAIEVYESLYAAPGSNLIADARGGGEVEISYRTPRPPVLLGDVEPEPSLSGSPFGNTGCAVCGNSELDLDETCDDGNTANGDGCNDECQAELCIAQTPDHPAVALCDDADACTLDVCDPATGCSNPMSCEEGLACTVDTCADGACVHAPDDAACDDLNDCTEDVCSPVMGCVYANLTGPVCEDGDICTVTGTCDAGACVATDVVTTGRSKLTFKFRDGVDDDRFKLSTEIPLADLTADPTVTGLHFELRDSNDRTIYSADVAAARWVDAGGSGRKFSFRDSRFEVPSANRIRSIKISKNESKGIAKVKLSTKGPDFPGADGEFRISASFLFGADASTDDCLTARFVPCEPKPSKRKNTCRD